MGGHAKWGYVWGGSRGPIGGGALVSLLSATAMAAGGLVPADAGPAVQSTGQRAVVILEGNKTTLVTQVGYGGTATDFAWIIPTTGNVPAVDVWETEAGVFDLLHDRTAPRLVSMEHSDRRFGCGGDAAASEQALSFGGFDVYQRNGQTVAILSIEAAADLTGWLVGQDYEVSSTTEAAIAAYETQGAFFVVVEVQGARSGASSGAPAPPIVVELLSNQPTYPLLLSGISTRRRMELLLYVIGHSRYDVGNVATVDMRVAPTFAGTDFDSWYEEQFAERLAEQQEPAFVVEYCDLVDQSLIDRVVAHRLSPATSGATRYFLTRLRGRFTPDEIDRDLTFQPVAADSLQRRLKIRVMAQPSVETLAVASPWALLGVGAWGWWCRRRRAVRGGD